MKSSLSSSVPSKRSLMSSAVPTSARTPSPPSPKKTRLVYFISSKEDETSDSETSSEESLEPLKQLEPPMIIEPFVYKLDNLPEDIYYFYLFKHLDIDQILEMRLISKRFYTLVKLHNIKELFFTGNYTNEWYNDIKDNWFSTTKQIQLKDQLSFSKLPLLNDLTYTIIHLRYLRICDNTIPYIRVEDISKFIKLEVLMIEGIDVSTSDLLSLPELKAFSIDNTNIFKGTLKSDRLIVDAPRLHSLHIFSYCLGTFDTIKILNPSSIKYLKTNYYGDFSTFNNLECLELKERFHENLEVENLLKLKNLKMLKLITLGHSTGYNSYIPNLIALYQTKKDALDIVLDGVKINGISKFNEHINRESLLKFQLDNFVNLEDGLDFVKTINYSYMQRLLNTTPANLFTKFSNLKKLLITKKIKDGNRLLNFIKSCQKLSSLSICGSKLGQDFYDRLPAYSQLTEFTIRGDAFEFNFNFLMRMHYLRVFFTYRDVELNETLNLNKLNYLQRFQFRIGGQVIFIRKEGKDKYLVDYCKGLELKLTKRHRLDKIIKAINILRDEKEQAKKRRYDSD